MHQIVEVIFGGIAQGAVYCVIAVGLSMVYGTARVLNFAHGSLYTTGGYIAWMLTAGYLGLPLWAGIALLVPILFLIGAGLERVVVRPLRAGANWKTTIMMATLGLAFLLDNLFQVLFGPIPKVIPPFTDGTIELMGTTVSLYRVWMLAIAVAIVVALEVFLSATIFGQAVRAVAQDMQGATQVGIDVNQIFAFTFGLSVVLTGLAGVLLAPIYLVSPLGGWAPFLKAFVIVVFGGLGSTRGAFIAAFVLALIEALVVYYVGASWTLPIWLITLLVVLMIRPRGLLGKWEA
ncbi:MAG: branched-chain amino acid ABC transporter permease [Hyphomicrobiaceae bacterium]